MIHFLARILLVCVFKRRKEIIALIAFCTLGRKFRGSFWGGRKNGHWLAWENEKKKLNGALYIYTVVVFVHIFTVDTQKLANSVYVIINKVEESF